MRCSTRLLAAAVCVLFLYAPDARAAKGIEPYVEGLQALAAHRYSDAVDAFKKALDAWDEEADYHIGIAAAYMMKGDDHNVEPHLERAAKLNPRHRILPLFRYAYIVMYDPHNTNRYAPYDLKEPYARPMLDALNSYSGAVAGNRSAEAAHYRKQIGAAVADYAWQQLADPRYIEAQRQVVRSLYSQRKYADCLALITRLLAGNPNDTHLIGMSANCRLGVGDVMGARAQYTQALFANPTDKHLLLGRAIAAGRMGALPTAREDFAIAVMIDAKASEPYRKEVEGLITSVQAKLTGESPDKLLARVKAASSNREAVAEQLLRADAATRLVGDEAFTEKLARLQHAFDRNPRSMENALALATFCIQPTVTRQPRLTSRKAELRVRVGKSDLTRAQRAVQAGLKIDANHVELLTQQGLLLTAQRNANGMIKVVEKALKLGGLNLDLVKMYFDYYQSLASQLEAEARALLQPRVHYEDRPDGRYRVTTYPSAADKARAAALEARANEYRKQSFGPLNSLRKKARGTTWGYLADAEFHRGVGEYPQAIAAAETALKIDPYHLEAHEFIIDLCPKIGQMDRALEQQDLLDNYAEPSARIALRLVWDFIEQTRYSSALQAIDTGERKDPASPRVAAYRAVTLGAARQANEADAAFETAVAIETARLSLGGIDPGGDQKAPLRAEDVGRLLALQVAWTRMTSRGNAADALGSQTKVLGMAYRVPQQQWDDELVSGSLPTVFDRKKDGRRKGIRIRELVIDGHVAASRLLSALKRYDEAARHIVAGAAAHGKMEVKAEYKNSGYPIYRKLGQAQASRVFPAEWVQYYAMLERHGSVRPVFTDKDPIGHEHMTELEKLEARLEQVTEELRLLSKSQTLTAKRKRPKLEKEKRRLESQIAELKRKGG